MTVHEYMHLLVPEQGVCSEIPKYEGAGWEFVTLTTVVMTNEAIEGVQGSQRKMTLLHLLLFRRPA